MPAQLLDLPNEILNQVIRYLDSDICLEQRFHSHPRNTWLELEERPLTHISVSSRRLRQLALPVLFRRARLNPIHLTDFLTFIHQHTLEPTVHSIVAHIEGPLSHIHPAWWCRLLNAIPTPTLILVGSPSSFSEPAKLHITVSDSWAFNIPYQLLELKQSPLAARQQIAYSNLPSIFAARPWHSLRVNEGSMLLAYTRYEYFLKKPPSLMADLQLLLSDYTTSANAGIDAIPPEMMPHSIMLIHRLFEMLRWFSYTAVFPFYNHTDEIMKCVRRMKRLERLEVRLCPEEGTRLLEDEMGAAGNRIDLNDPWNEFHTSYNLIAFHVHNLSLPTNGHLHTFTTQDWHLTAVRATLESQINDRLLGQRDWVYSGQGTWVNGHVTGEANIETETEM